MHRMQRMPNFLQTVERAFPGTHTKNEGTHENPLDLSADTWKIVRFPKGLPRMATPTGTFFRNSVGTACPPDAWLKPKTVRSYRMKILAL